jgi:hypothetical protein
MFQLFGRRRLLAAAALLALAWPLASAWGQAVDLELQRLPSIEELPALESGTPEWLASDDLCWHASSGMPSSSGLMWHAGGKARGYYINDHRIEFTGQEATFAVEGVVAGGIEQQQGDWLYQLESELFLNQPFDRNLLVDDTLRQSFAPNFDIEPLQISQLYLTTQHGNWSATLGRFVTPFGRFYYPLYRNNFDDSPFIRSEAILYRETGLLVEWQPEGWHVAAAITNGGPEQDTNSSKALVARAGIDREWFACGASVKTQDGIGSEGQKQFKSHAGLDAMLRRGPWTLSAEVIHDEYGLRRPGLLPEDIFWGRSLYYRDLNNGVLNEITGLGYYVNLGYEGPRWSLTLNYGEFHPEQIGHAQHDTVTRRGLLKASRHWTENFESYGVLLLENDLADAFGGHTRYGTYLIFGGQFVL